MPKARRLIIGLGNPGAEYEGTRHNVGFMVADVLAEAVRAPFVQEGELLIAWCRHRGRTFAVAKPMTFMNRSGRAVRRLLGLTHLEASEMLVIYDDLNLDTGRIRLRERGSAGGHNGVQDVIDRLGTDAFPRLRIGIGDDYRRGQQVDYVLSRFSAEQQPAIDEAISSARDAALTFVREGIVTAMNQFN